MPPTSPPGTSRPIVAYLPDLMDRSRVAAVAAELGRELVVSRTPADLVARADEPEATFVVDLSRAGAVEILAALPAGRSFAIAGHVDRELMRAARAAGDVRVLARSAFFASLGELLA
ncbi:MAG TPA: hypothetical protein VND23_00505 [Acidimicrobiales bacterium]|nr:hypothetical protein [Acidimicrobiales bacterium]